MAMLLAQDLNGGSSYRQAIFTGLKNVSNRYPEPGAKVFQHFYSDVNSRLLMTFTARSGRAAGGWFARKECSKRNKQCEPIPYHAVRKPLTLSGHGNGYSIFTEPDPERRCMIIHGFQEFDY